MNKAVSACLAVTILAGSSVPVRGSTLSLPGKAGSIGLWLLESARKRGHWLAVELMESWLGRNASRELIW